MRYAVRKILNVATNVYFSKIEVRGLKNLQAAGTKTGCVFAGNHPSGLVDPMVIMSAVDLPMSSIAKHSLFSTPVIGAFVRAMRAVPVMQPYDPGLPPDKQPTAEERQTMNEQMFSTVQERLVDEGFNIVIFPEGTCHSTPQIKQMRVGTARMTLQIAAKGGPRVPIIPVGLSYSVPSGAAFRAKVLVDFGKPIEVTDEMLAQYTSGDREQALLLEEKLMKRVERHLRHVTIRVPDWTELLANFCEKELPGSAAPVYELIENDASRGSGVDKRKQQVSVRVGEHHHSGGGGGGGGDATPDSKIFYSRNENESSGDARKRRKAVETSSGIAYVPKLPQVLKRQAARNALFSIQGFEPAPRDWEFINLMHLARHIYKPEGKPVTLAQYASLTRNFMHVVLDRLSDPQVQKLWKDLKAYRRELDQLGVTDKYIARFIQYDLDGDGKVDVAEQLQAEMSSVLQQNRIELAKQVFLIPLGLLGTVLHVPVMLMAHWMGIKMGVSEARDGGAPSTNKQVDGKDQSVVATMQMMGGLVGVVVLYPSIGLATALFTPFSPLLTVSCAAVSGYAMALSQPVDVFVRKMNIARRLHSSTQSDEWMSALKHRRETLQRDIRTFADVHAPNQTMQGWWKNPEKYVISLKAQQLEAERQWLSSSQRVTEETILDANLTTLNIPLRRNKRHPLERAVLTSRTEEGNRKALLWLPGRNDSFYHVHILDRLLATGFDVHALDLRRCGRSKYDTSGMEITDELFAHDSYDFGEYNEEIDAVLKYLKNPGRRTVSDSIYDGGCGKVYENVVCYAHSTGALVAASYGARGSENSGAWRGALDGFIFNSPFFQFNLPWYQNVAMNSGLKIVDPDHVLATGGGTSDYSRKLFQHYGFRTPEHKSLKELHVTAGWVAAVTNIQDQLVQGRLRLPPFKPALVLSTSADEVLSQEHIISRTPLLCADPEENKWPIEKPIWETGVVERRIGTSADSQSAHDVLAAPSSSRVDEAMGHLERWLTTHFP